MKFVSAAALMFLSALVAHAGLIGTNDFLYKQVTTFDGLGVSDSNPSGLPFNIYNDTTIDNNTYSAPLRYSDFLYAGAGNCLANECLGEGQAGGTLTITLGTPVNAVGFYVGVSSVNVTFFDHAGTALMAPQTVTPGSNPSAVVWFGWRSDAGQITSVEIDGIANNKIFTIDNFTAELPEPGTGLMLGAGVLVAGLLRRKR